MAVLAWLAAAGGEGIKIKIIKNKNDTIKISKNMDNSYHYFI